MSVDFDTQGTYATWYSYDGVFVCVCIYMNVCVCVCISMWICHCAEKSPSSWDLIFIWTCVYVCVFLYEYITLQKHVLLTQLHIWPTYIYDPPTYTTHIHIWPTYTYDPPRHMTHTHNISLRRNIFFSWAKRRQRPLSHMQRVMATRTHTHTHTHIATRQGYPRMTHPTLTMRHVTQQMRHISHTNWVIP